MPKQREHGQDLDCAQVQALLYDYLSDLLSDERRAQVERHLSTCPDCQKELAEIRGMLSVLNRAEEVPLPDGFAASLHEKLESVSKELRGGEVQTPAAGGLWNRFRDFVVHTNWRIAAPAALAVVLVVSVFSTGLYRTFRNADDTFDRSGITPLAQSTSAPEDATAPPNAGQEAAPSAAAQAPEPDSGQAVQREDKKMESEPKRTAAPANKTQQRQEASSSEPDRKQADRMKSEDSAGEPDSTEAPVQNESATQGQPAEQKPAEVEKSAAPPQAMPEAAKAKTEAEAEATGGANNAETYSAVPEAMSLDEGGSGGSPEPAAPKRASGESAGAGDSNGLLQSAPASGSADSMYKDEAVPANPVYELSVDDPEAFLEGWGASGSASSLTLSRSRFESFRSYAKANGGALTLVQDGDGDQVVIEIN